MKENPYNQKQLKTNISFGNKIFPNHLLSLSPPEETWPRATSETLPRPLAGVFCATRRGDRSTGSRPRAAPRAAPARPDTRPGVTTRRMHMSPTVYCLFTIPELGVQSASPVVAEPQWSSRGPRRRLGGFVSETSLTAASPRLRVR